MLAFIPPLGFRLKVFQDVWRDARADARGFRRRDRTLNGTVDAGHVQNFYARQLLL